MTTDDNNESSLDLLGRIDERIASRREFLGDAALVGGGALALAAVGAGSTAADEHEMGGDSEDIDDVDVLNYALTLEHLEYAFYDEFLSNHSESEVEGSEVARYFARPTLRYSLYQHIEDLKDHEKAHVDALTQAINDLGGTPVEAADYEFGYGSFEEFLAIAARIEDVGVSAYAGAAPLLSNPDLIPPALSIHSVEARHAAYLDTLNLRRAFPDAFDMARSMDQVLPIAKQFIVTEEDDDTEEFNARLSGDNEVPPVGSDASGRAMFTLADHGAGPHLHYELSVSNAENITQAHIHVGGPDENGEVVVFLFGAEDAQGNFVGALEEGVDKSGMLAEGSLTAEHLIGPLEGMDLSALAEEMRAGNTYVNVHSTQNPAGEIRGQIESGTRPAESEE